MVQRMIKHITGRYSKHIMSWQDLEAEFEINVSKRTIQHAMKKYGYKKCKACQKEYITEATRQKRLEFAKKRLNWTD